MIISISFFFLFDGSRQRARGVISLRLTASRWSSVRKKDHSVELCKSRIATLTYIW